MQSLNVVVFAETIVVNGLIAASIGNEGEDSWERHMFATVKGGDYLVDQDKAEILARGATVAIIMLEHMGVTFSRNKAGKIDQRRFGGHTRYFGSRMRSGVIKAIIGARRFTQRGLRLWNLY